MADDSVQTAVTVDLGGEQFVLEGVECREALGEPFAIEVHVMVKLGEIDVLPHLGKPMSLKIDEHHDLARYFHGILVESEFLHESLIGHHYRLVARPFTHFMDQNRRFQIFQDKSALDIVKAVFADAGVGAEIDYSGISASYAPRVYCVQYGESDFAFVSRLMEEEGIYYYYRHEAQHHHMVLCDGPGAHAPGKPAKLFFNASALGARALGIAGRPLLARLTERLTARVETKVTIRDFDLEKPKRAVEGEWSDNGVHPGEGDEFYDYPGRFVDEARAAQLSKVRLAAMRAERQTYVGASQSVGISCGRTVDVTDHPADRLNQSYLVTRTHHRIRAVAVAEERGPEEAEYNVWFDAIPAKTMFHSPQRTPRPQVVGLESAIVSGPDGETIYTDQYGRVKIRFHWDRSGSPGERSTCWVRVAQFGNHGSVILPRVGQEVMIAFLHGDPDRPIVSGWTFNEQHKPIYALPEHKTRSLWRTLRYGDTGRYPDTEGLDTGSPGVNELRFEDKGGVEEVFLHAERDMNTRIRFDETHHVGHVQDVKVGHDRTDKVGNDETTKIGNNQTLEVTGNQTEKIKAKRDIDVSDSDKLHVGQTIKIDAGTTIEISANQSITLKVGSSKLTIDQKGIKLEGFMLEQAATVQSKMTGVLVNVEAQGITTVKGGVVMIN